VGATAWPLSNHLPADGSPCCTEVEAELDNIWYYVAKESGSIEIADRLIDSITERFFLLACHPHIGRHRDVDLRLGLRSFPVGEYVIIYRTEKQDVLILHVFRGSRDIEALLRQ
jgi:toxin ParE1/3/4